MLSDFQENNMKSGKPGFHALCEKYTINKREQKIIRMMMNGLLHKEIASRMNLSTRSVDYHLSKIYKKCNVTNKYNLLKIFQG